MFAYVGITNFQTDLPSSHNAITVKANQSKSTSTEGIANLSLIPGWHLFGYQDDKPKTKPAPKQHIEAPKTPLELTLQGTLLGNSATEESWAIISAPDFQQKMYKVGDEIPGGAILYAIESFQVILTRNNRHESLSLPRPLLDGPETSSTNKLPSPKPSASLPMPLPSEGLSPAESEERALVEEMNRIRREFPTR